MENSITAEKADGSAFTMFNVEKSTATVHGENINIELYLKANASGKFSYTGIYLGSKEDEEKTPVIEGTINEDNNQVYKFQHSAEQSRNKITVCTDQSKRNILQQSRPVSDDSGVQR